MKIRRTIAYTVLGIVSFLCLFWFLALFNNATRSNDNLIRGFSLIPGNYTLINFKNVIHSNLPVVSATINSIFIALAASIICSYFSILTAFGIHAYEFRGKKFLYGIMIAFMMIPRQVTALGFVDLVNDLKMMNTFWPLILPDIAAPVVFYYMIKYLKSILPMSLVEAARMDGASEWTIFNRIVLPLMKPAFAVQMIFKFVESWNNYFIPALILQDDSKKTMPILIAIMRSSNFMESDNGRIYMMIAISILPAVIIYLLLSQHIIGGVTSGGVKG